MVNQGFTISTEINVLMEEKDVYFIGEACTDKYVKLEQLEQVNEYFVNQPVVYRHDHPAKGKGGSIYGRVVKSEIVEKEKGVHSLLFKAKMKQTSKKHKDLIELARSQEKLGSPIRYSIAFTNDENVGDDAEVYEVSITNDPVCEECENLNIMEKVNMPDKKEIDVEKEIASRDLIISEMQKKFEDSINFKKELEATNKELVQKVAEYEKAGAEYKGVLETYESRLAELESKADRASRTPLVEKIWALERNDYMKDRYMNSKEWSVTDLEKQYDVVKNLNKGKIDVGKAVTRTLEQSRSKLMDVDESQQIQEFESKIKNTISPELKKMMGLK